MQTLSNIYYCAQIVSQWTALLCYCIACTLWNAVYTGHTALEGVHMGWQRWRSSPGIVSMNINEPRRRCRCNPVRTYFNGTNVMTSRRLSDCDANYWLSRGEMSKNHQLTPFAHQISSPTPRYNLAFFMTSDLFTLTPNAHTTSNLLMENFAETSAVHWKVTVSFH